MLKRLAETNAIDLAAEPPFEFGSLLVEPARLRIMHGGESRQLEPRVMQVFTVLAQADGRVVSRDELVERCWDGRIVGENALQRVISRLRHLAADIGGFELETVPRVGYLVRATEAALAPLDTGDTPAFATDLPPAERVEPARTPAIHRRLLLGAAAAAAAAVGFAIWRAAGPSDPARAEAATLLAKAREAGLADLPEQTRQAIAYLERATAIEPDLADAWGLLALSYQKMLYSVHQDELPVYADRARLAASRALALDPESVEAKVAIATIPPNFRNWERNERALRLILAAHGSHPAIETAIGWTMCETGRWRDAIASFRRALAFETFHPGNRITLARGLWGFGKLAEAGDIIEDAHRLWPGHRLIWDIRFNFLSRTGRPGTALAMVEDPANHPLLGPGDKPPPFDALASFARAQLTGLPADIAAANAAIGTPASPGPLGYHAMFLIAMSRIDEAFAFAERYFFGGSGRPPPGPLSRRKSSFLFNHDAQPLRRDPRFRPLVERIGLGDYWRRTGTRPDVPF